MDDKKKLKEEKIIIVEKKEDLNKLTKEELKSFSINCLEIINNFTNTKENDLENQLQLDINILEINRRKLLTVYEIMGNSLNLLEHKTNDVGKTHTRFMLSQTNIDEANVVVFNALKQLNEWLKTNNLNKKNYETKKK